MGASIVFNIQSYSNKEVYSKTYKKQCLKNLKKYDGSDSTEKPDKS